MDIWFSQALLSLKSATFLYDCESWSNFDRLRKKITKLRKWIGLDCFPENTLKTAQEKQKWPSREKILSLPDSKVVAWIKQPKILHSKKSKAKNILTLLSASSSSYLLCTANCTAITIADAGKNSGTVADVTQHRLLEMQLIHRLTHKPQQRQNQNSWSSTKVRLSNHVILSLWQKSWSSVVK